LRKNLQIRLQEESYRITVQTQHQYEPENVDIPLPYKVCISMIEYDTSFCHNYPCIYYFTAKLMYKTTVLIYMYLC
jgi:hypothetical protein